MRTLCFLDQDDLGIWIFIFSGYFGLGGNHCVSRIDFYGLPYAQLCVRSRKHISIMLMHNYTDSTNPSFGNYAKKMDDQNAFDHPFSEVPSRIELL